MNYKHVLSTTVVVFSSLLAPVVPTDTDFVMAWKYECTGVVPDYSNAIYDPTLEFLTLEPCEGTKYTAAHRTNDGDLIYQEITEERYREMGQVDGKLVNPEKTEFQSVLDAMVVPAEAAISHLNAGLNNCADATSCTYAYNSGSTGSNRMMVVGFEVFKTTDTITSATYNGSSMTKIGHQTNVGAGATIHMYAIANPATGSNNLVVNMSSSDSPQMRIAVYDDMSSTFPDAFVTDDDNGVTIQNTTLTTIANNAWTVKVWGNSSCGGADTAGSGVVRAHNACAGIMDSNAAITPAGSASLQINSGSGATNFYSVMASFAPAPAVQATGTPITLQGNVLIQGNVLFSR